MRSVSLIVVVVWHWAFTILRWSPDGPMPTSPLGFFSGLWIFTWLLQVMPMFFYVGGYVHLVSWQRARARGDPLGRFVLHQIRRLVAPAGALVLIWTAFGVTAASMFNLRWIRGAVLLIISPLWFLAVYVVLLAVLPLSLWLHRKFDVVVLVWLGGVALGADVVRFRYGVDQAGWVNMIAVWGLAHQAGFFYRRLVGAPRRWGHALLWTGLFALAGLVFSGLYPGSMVGVPGDRLSNMGPPTFVIVALLTFQSGFAEVTRPFFEPRLARPRWRRFIGLLDHYALPLFLFHTTGMAVRRLASTSSSVTAYPMTGSPTRSGGCNGRSWWPARCCALFRSCCFLKEGGCCIFAMTAIAVLLIFDVDSIGVRESRNRHCFTHGLT